MFTLRISTANEAFDNQGAEIARILRRVADIIEAYETRPVLKAQRAIRDVNGNTVGKWELR